jgi:hypothetical protein
VKVVVEHGIFAVSPMRMTGGECRFREMKIAGV